MDLKNFLDFVALATIADIVPLVDENRIFARKGLLQLDRTIHPGLSALKSVANVGTPAKSLDVSHKLGPKVECPPDVWTPPRPHSTSCCVEDPNMAKNSG